MWDSSSNASLDWSGLVCSGTIWYPRTSSSKSVNACNNARGNGLGSSISRGITTLGLTNSRSTTPGSGGENDVSGTKRAYQPKANTKIPIPIIWEIGSIKKMSPKLASAPIIGKTGNAGMVKEGLYQYGFLCRRVIKETQIMP